MIDDYAIKIKKNYVESVLIYDDLDGIPLCPPFLFLIIFCRSILKAPIGSAISAQLLKKVVEKKQTEVCIRDKRL